MPLQLERSKDVFFAAVGIGDLAVEKGRKTADAVTKFLKSEQTFTPFSIRSENGKFAISLNRGQLTDVGTKVLDIVVTVYDRRMKSYTKMVDRGNKVVKDIKGAPATKAAMAQSKAARSKTKAAVTSIRKASDISVDAAKEAVSSAL